MMPKVSNAVELAHVTSETCASPIGVLPPVPDPPVLLEPPVLDAPPAPIDASRSLWLPPEPVDCEPLAPVVVLEDPLAPVELVPAVPVVPDVPVVPLSVTGVPLPPPHAAHAIKPIVLKAAKAERRMIRTSVKKFRPPIL
jgi:hypothetical protein